MQKLSLFYRNNVIAIGLLILFLGYLGRGVENSLLTLNLFLAINVSIYLILQNSFKLELQKASTTLIFVWAGMYLLWLISTQFNGVLSLGIVHWLVSFLSSSIVLMIVILQNPDSLQASLRSKYLAFGLAISLSYFVLSFLNCFGDKQCHPATDISAMSIPIIFPFISLFLMQKPRWLISLNLLALVFLMLIWFAESRTEVLMFIIMLGFLNALYLRIARYIVVIPFFILITLYLYFAFERSFDPSGMDMFALFNQVSSYRLEIWWHALANLPQNIFIGSGIDNTNAYLPSYRFSDALHNAFLEILYETGLLGLLAFLTLNLIFMRRLIFVYKSECGSLRTQYIIFFSSYLAVLVAGFLDKGQMSFYYKYVIFLIGGSVFYIGEQLFLKNNDSLR